MISFLKRRLDLNKIKIERRGLLGFLCFEATKAMVWEALRWLCDVMESKSIQEAARQATI